MKCLKKWYVKLLWKIAGFPEETGNRLTMELFGTDDGFKVMKELLKLRKRGGA